MERNDGFTVNTEGYTHAHQRTQIYDSYQVSFCAPPPFPPALRPGSSSKRLLRIKVPYQDFFIESMSSMSVDVLLQDVYNWKKDNSAGPNTRFYLSDHAFLIPTAVKKVRFLYTRREREREMESDVYTYCFIFYFFCLEIKSSAYSCLLGSYGRAATYGRALYSWSSLASPLRRPLVLLHQD